MTAAADRKAAAQICGFAQESLAQADRYAELAAVAARDGNETLCRRRVELAVTEDLRAAESHARAAGLRQLARLSSAERAAARQRSYARWCAQDRCGSGLMPTSSGGCPRPADMSACRHARPEAPAPAALFFCPRSNDSRVVPERPFEALS